MAGHGVQVSVLDLINEYKNSVSFKRLSNNTKALYSTTLGKFTSFHKTNMNELRRRDVLRHLDDYYEQPGTYRIVRALWGILFRFALDREYIDFAPVLRMEAPEPGEYAAWTPTQVNFGLANWPEPLRRVIILALFSGQRRGDLCRMPWPSYDGAGIRLTQQKTGTALYIPAHPILKDELDRWYEERMTGFILEINGYPWDPNKLTKAFQKEARRAAETKGLVLHGLRKTAAVLLSESSCTIHEIASITGHKTLAMLSHYTKAAEQIRLSRSAIQKMDMGFLLPKASLVECLPKRYINQV